MLEESHRRVCATLEQDLGEGITAALQNAAVTEIMLNPDGSLWADHREKGQYALGRFSSAQGYAVIHAVAGVHNKVITEDNPYLEAALPHFGVMRGERFTAHIPPMVAGPCFTVRKKSNTVWTLADYLAQGRLSPVQLAALSTLVRQRKNILVCGGPGSGKTTLLNALIVEAVAQNPAERFVLLEDTPELQCAAANSVAMLTSANVDSIQLLRLAMRMRPDRIVLGEVRGSEALVMLKAWNTGCPGGFCTVHANGAIEAVQRIGDLALEAGIPALPLRLIEHTVDAIIALRRFENKAGRIHEIVSLGEYRDGQFTFKKIA